MDKQDAQILIKRIQDRLKIARKGFKGFGGLVDLIESLVIVAIIDSTRTRGTKKVKE